MHSTEALHVEGKYAVDDDSHAPFREMSRNFVKISPAKTIFRHIDCPADGLL
jgi:hypothetical protein